MPVEQRGGHQPQQRLDLLPAGRTNGTAGANPKALRHPDPIVLRGDAVIAFLDPDDELSQPALNLISTPIVGEIITACFGLQRSISRRS